MKANRRLKLRGARLLPRPSQKSSPAIMHLPCQLYKTDGEDKDMRKILNKQTFCLPCFAMNFQFTRLMIIAILKQRL